MRAITKIKPVLVSPSKDPRAFEIRGTLIAIRKEDAIKIIKCNLKKIDNKVYILLRKTFLRIECNVYIDEKEAEDN